MPATSRELPGLIARLDRLCHHRGGLALPPDKPHAFVYYITISNGSDRTVTLLGRKWVIAHADGSHQVIEGDKITGDTPRLPPGEEYSYHSYMVTGDNARVTGSFHGVDEFGHPVHVLLPTFAMEIPEESDE